MKRFLGGHKLLLCENFFAKKFVKWFWLLWKKLSIFMTFYTGKSFIYFLIKFNFSEWKAKKHANIVTHFFVQWHFSINTKFTIKSTKIALRVNNRKNFRIINSINLSQTTGRMMNCMIQRSVFRALVK